MKPHLYINPDGYPVTRHSYSGSQTFRYCARLYELEKVAGWHQKEEKAAQFFGKAIENAVRLAHAAQLEQGADFFQDEWEQFKDKPLVYAKTEGDWDALLKTGREMMKLYAIFYPNTGFAPNPEFQVKVTKDIEGIEFVSYLDMIVHKCHLVPEGEDPQECEKIILDCKVSGAKIPTMIGLDPQLRSYAWVTGISKVGFLWFEKNGRKISTDDEVILLSGPSKGALRWVASTSEELHDVFGPPSMCLVSQASVLEEIEKRFKGARKEEDKIAKSKFITEHSVAVPIADFTKQRIYLDTAVISPESQRDIGDQIHRDIHNIQFAGENNFWPMESGVRFPNDKCPNCMMRGICSGNNRLRDELVTRGKTIDKKGYEFNIWND